MAHALRGEEPYSALAMAIKVVTAAFGKEVQRSGKPLACTQRTQHRKVVHRRAERSCLPADHGWRMRIGVAHKPVVVKFGANPVHRRVRGEPRLHGEDMFGKVEVTVRHGVEPGLRPKNGEPRRPDVGWNQEAPRA